MFKPNPNSAKAQAGFTLVELAVVMIIIGLLIGGVLKGQELISNAQVTATIAQVKGIEAATSTFRDVYAGFPGDILNPDTRLPNCTAAPCSTAGTGNGRLDNIPSVAAADTNEGGRFFIHLSAADLISGVAVTGGTYTAGSYLPAAKINSLPIRIGYALNGGNLTGSTTNAGTASAGHYIVLSDTIAGAAITAASIGLKPTEALRVDTKLDDGVAYGGSIRAITNANCAAAAGNYVTSNGNNACALYIRIQG